MSFYVVRPIDQWPGKLTPYQRRMRPPFRTEWPRTEQLLEREIVRFLAGRDVVFALAVNEYDVRIDGGLRANARTPEHPGIIIAFRSKYGPLQYATDTYTDWKGNARAIALGLEALRAVDRYGITRRGEQYTGFARLAAPATDMSIEEAHGLLVRLGGFREAAKTTHPDAGGDPMLFRRVTAAKSILEHAGVGVP